MLALAPLAIALLTGCGSSSPRPPASPAAPSSTPLPGGRGPGSPPVSQPRPAAGNIYFADGAGMLSPTVRNVRSRVYVPNTMSNTVDVIDPAKMRVVAHFKVGQLPQHVTPSWDLKTLYVDNDLSNTLTPVDPISGRPRGRDIPVADPYNLYFTPAGDYAIVVAEKLKQLDFRDPHTMRLRHSLSVPGCPGVDHMDFSAQGRYAYASCEFGAAMIEVDLRRQRVVKTLHLAGGAASPQDVKLAPDGKVLYAADQAGGGLWKINPHSFKVIGFLRTGVGAHGLYPSRDSRSMYVSNRGEGSVSVVSFATRRVIHKWKIPGKASPDMGGVSIDGRTLWLSGRYDAEVYALDTRTGRLLARIPVGQGPHGLSVWPQPGRFSLGHTGIMR
ncbi:MAG TPA: hypothetical protein VGN69_07820 [Solirubrobacteraceae bacterium]|jgi:YVTN family beta-propeller protein|nr:hypothetical protein [Solirubrobacteraceae bacterium]